MNQDRIKGICLQLAGSLKELVGTLTGDPCTVSAGASDRCAGRMLVQRGRSAQEADRQLAEFMRRNRNWWDLSAH